MPCVHAQVNPLNPEIKAQDIYPSDQPRLVGAADGQDALKCYILNTAAQRMEPQGFGGSAPKEWTSFGFHTQPTMETQVLLAPSASWYRPLARLPKNDGCAYQANFGAGTNSGCNITGVPAEPLTAGGFRFPDPYSNNSHCQLFASCMSKEAWESDPRHRGDLGAQGQWCSEIGGCWRPGVWLFCPALPPPPPTLLPSACRPAWCVRECSARFTMQSASAQRPGHS